MTSTRLPDFVVIGAMKAGSTTLYEDLRGQPGVVLGEKELGPLYRPDLDVRGYAALFSPARPDQVVGDVSATYAKLPESAGIAERAARLLGDQFRVVYLVREPVDRTVSHHYHRLSRRTIDPSVDVAVRTDHRLIDYSRYGMQIQPWVDAVGTERIHLIHFERYVTDRVGVLGEVLRFLGAPDAPPVVDSRTVYNRSDGRHVAAGLRGRIPRAAVYRRRVRPYLPEAVRRRLAGALLPAAPPRPGPPSAATVDLILDRTAADLARLIELFGPAAPRWDAEATRARYEALRSSRITGRR